MTFLRAALLALALLAALGTLGSCTACASPPGTGRMPPGPTAYRREALAILDRMSLRAKAGQVLLVGVSGTGRPARNEAQAVTSLGPGGVILFGFNISGDLESLADLTGGLQDAAKASESGLPLLVAVDHEGGPVFRFAAGVTMVPSAAVVGARGPVYAEALGRAAGEELLALGCNLALAPVVEVRRPDNEAFLGNRSYGTDPSRVDAAAGAYLRGLQAAGVAATAKHYPGNARTDPHKGLPVLEATASTLRTTYLARFAAATRQGVGFILLSHALVPALDPDNPVTLSRKAIQGLKSGLGFQGVVLTDDLYMAALAESRAPEVTGPLAVAAGADLLMLSEGKGAPRVRDALVAAVQGGRLPESRLNDAVLRIIEQKLRFRLERAFDGVARKAAVEGLQDLVDAHAGSLRGK